MQFVLKRIFNTPPSWCFSPTIRLTFITISHDLSILQSCSRPPFFVHHALDTRFTFLFGSYTHVSSTNVASWFNFWAVLTNCYIAVVMYIRMIF